MIEVVTDPAGNASIQVKDTTGSTKTLLNSAGNSYLNGGNVGIGTTSPSEKLDVAGNISVYNSYAAGASLFLNHSNQYSSSIIKSIADTIDTQDAGSSMLRFYTNDNSTTSPTVALDLTSESNAIFYGKVGIGTISPTRSLHLNSSSNNYIRLQTTVVNGYAGVEFENDARTWTAGITNADAFVLSGGAQFSGGYPFMLETAAPNASFIVKTSGNVGIGTTSPSAKLEINSTTGWGLFTERGIKDGSTSSYSHNYSAGNAHILGRSTVFESSVTFSTLTATSTTKEYRLNNTSDKLTLASVVGGVTTDNNILVASGANVGIGTASPSAKLDIEGDLQVKGVNISNQENLDVDTGTETIATVAIADYDAAFFDYVIKNGTDLRAGTVFAVHNGTSVEFTETSTSDLGNTSRVTLSVDISGADMRLRATATSDDWIVKSLVRAI